MDSGDGMIKRCEEEEERRGLIVSAVKEEVKRVKAGEGST